MARRSLSGAVDFGYLETYAGGDLALVEEVLGLFRQQTEIWGPMLDPASEARRDAAGTVKGAARGLEPMRWLPRANMPRSLGRGALPTVHAQIDAAPADVAAYLHELALQSPGQPRS